MSWHCKEQRAKQSSCVGFKEDEHRKCAATTTTTTRRIGQQLCKEHGPKLCRKRLTQWQLTSESMNYDMMGQVPLLALFLLQNNICSTYEYMDVCMCVCVNTQRNINKYCQLNIQLVIPSACLLPSSSLAVFPLLNFDLNSMMAAILSFTLHFSLSLSVSRSLTVFFCQWHSHNTVSFIYLQKFIEIVCQIPFTCFSHFLDKFSFCRRRRWRLTSISTSVDVLCAILSFHFLFFFFLAVNLKTRSIWPFRAISTTSFEAAVYSVSFYKFDTYILLHIFLFFSFFCHHFLYISVVC